VSLLWKARVARMASNTVKTAKGIKSEYKSGAGEPLRKIFLSTDT
jgi:hypothetical protein